MCATDICFLHPDSTPSGGPLQALPVEPLTAHPTQGPHTPLRTDPTDGCAARPDAPHLTGPATLRYPLTVNSGPPPRLWCPHHPPPHAGRRFNLDYIYSYRCPGRDPHRPRAFGQTPITVGFYSATLTPYLTPFGYPMLITGPTGADTFTVPIADPDPDSQPTLRPDASIGLDPTVP